MHVAWLKFSHNEPSFLGIFGPRRSRIQGPEQVLPALVSLLLCLEMYTLQLHMIPSGCSKQTSSKDAYLRSGNMRDSIMWSDSDSVHDFADIVI